MSSVLHNPGQVLNQRLLKELTKEIGGDSLKPLSRAESFNRHQLGGSVNFLNYQL